MRLKDLLNQVEEEYIFEYEIKDDPSNSNRIIIRNYQNTMIYLSRIRKFEFIKENIDELEEKCGAIFNSRTKELKVETSLAKMFIEKMNIIQGKLDTLFNIGENYVKNESCSDINIRIPNNGLTEIGTIFKTIDKAIGQIIINDTLKGKIEVKKFETGSLWVSIGVGTVAAITFIGRCLWTAEAIRKKHYEAEASRIYINAIENQSEDLDKARKLILDAIENELSKDYSDATNKLIKENSLEKEGNEYSEKLKFALKTFNELMEKGVEFKPNALATEDIKNLFPSNTVSQKLLGDTKSDEKE